MPNAHLQAATPATVTRAADRTSSGGSSAATYSVEVGGRQLSPEPTLPPISDGLTPGSPAPYSRVHRSRPGEGSRSPSRRTLSSADQGTADGPVELRSTLPDAGVGGSSASSPHGAGGATGAGGTGRRGDGETGRRGDGGGGTPAGAGAQLSGTYDVPTVQAQAPMATLPKKGRSLLPRPTGLVPVTTDRLGTDTTEPRRSPPKHRCLLSGTYDLTPSRLQTDPGPVRSAEPMPDRPGAELSMMQEEDERGSPTRARSNRPAAPAAPVPAQVPARVELRSRNGRSAKPSRGKTPKAGAGNMARKHARTQASPPRNNNNNNNNGPRPPGTATAAPAADAIGSVIAAMVPDAGGMESLLFHDSDAAVTPLVSQLEHYFFVSDRPSRTSQSYAAPYAVGYALLGVDVYRMRIGADPKV